MNAKNSDLLTGLPPILDAGVEVVVLGSFPSPASLAAQQYYAHPQNQFWRLMGELLSEPLAGLPYAGRCAVLLRHRVGVWDVYRHCRREGACETQHHRCGCLLRKYAERYRHEAR